MANSQKELEKVLDKVLEYSSADQTEVLAAERTQALTRFSNSQIHQNMAEKNIHLSVRVVKDNRIGWSSTHSFEKKSIEKTVDLALTIARARDPDPDFKSLPAQTGRLRKIFFSEDTLNYSPEARANKVLEIITKASQNNFLAAGAFRTGGGVFGIANSLGIKTVSPLSEAALNTVIMSETSSGYANVLSDDATKVNAEKLAEIAVEKALRSQNPMEIEAGEYTVVLEAEAVADMLAWLGISGLGALSVQEGRSFMCDNFGKQIVGENLTLWDDGQDPRTLGLPFDFEGVAKQKVILIEEGIAKNVVYDSYTANKEGKKSTGHALPAPNVYGPLPLNVFMKEGNTPLDEMISGTERGILVTRFHYTNLEDPIKTIFTGMTRDGTFLIENGKIGRGLKNFRFTQNILEALSQIQAISPELEVKEVLGVGVYNVPALKIAKFNFTGISPT